MIYLAYCLGWAMALASAFCGWQLHQVQMDRAARREEIARELDPALRRRGV